MVESYIFVENAHTFLCHSFLSKLLNDPCNYVWSNIVMPTINVKFLILFWSFHTRFMKYRTHDVFMKCWSCWILSTVMEKWFFKFGLISICVCVCVDIPGFYYDAEKNRYFPLSSRMGQEQRKVNHLCTFLLKLK